MRWCLLAGLTWSQTALGFGSGPTPQQICEADIAVLLRIENRQSSLQWVDGGTMQTVVSTADTRVIHHIRGPFPEGTNIPLRTRGGKMDHNGGTLEVAVEHFPRLDTGTYYAVLLKLGLTETGHPAFVAFQAFPATEPIPTKEQVRALWRLDCEPKTGSDSV